MFLKGTTFLSRSLLLTNNTTKSNLVYNNCSFKTLSQQIKLTNYESKLLKNINKSTVFEYKITNSIYSSSSLKLADDKQQQTVIKSQIISSQPNAQVSDELKNIMAKKFMTEEETTATNKPIASSKLNGVEKTGEGPNEEAPKGRFAMLFSREHAWKVSLTFFVALIGGSFVYILVDWGSPRLDENNQIV
jgi:hypothetical protein